MKMIDERARDSARYEGVLRTARYEIEDVLGQGTWGTVYRAKDSITGKPVALKVLTPSALAREQMTQRGQTPQSVLMNEGGDLHACARIVPRTLEVDENGIYFLRMPVMDRFLDRILIDEGPDTIRPSLLPYDTVVSYAKDLVAGLREMHEIRRDVHADLKPANVALDGLGRLYLNDLGTSTCASLEPIASGTKHRGERGFEFTRAPECFLGKYPSRSSDVWGVAALIYRMISKDGKYPLEDELKNVTDKGAYLEQLGEERLRILLNHKIRQNISTEYRSLKRVLEECLDPEPDKRISSAEFASNLNYTTGKRKFLQDAWKFTRRFGIALGTVAAIGAASYFVVTAPEPLPRETPRVSGMLYLEEKGGKSFDIEEPFDLPRAMEGMLTGGTTSIARRSTSNPTIAFLIDTRAKSLIGGEKGRLGERITETEQDLFDRYATSEEKEGVRNNSLSDFYVVPAVALEAQMNKLREVRGGNVDLEDLLATVRVGEQKVMYAKMAAKSPHFRDYSEHLIDEDEVNMVKQWLAFIHEGVGRK